jgi:hypothetical protein
VRKTEIQFWIKQGWLQATLKQQCRRTSYSITPEALKHAYSHHLMDLLKRGIPNQSLFEAYVQYVHSPKHTVGEQLLDVRRDKKERAAYAATHENDLAEKGDVDDDGIEEEYRVTFDGDIGNR